ncbi:hypothetical protein B7P43_G06670 [Cryptotermes secundus]|uniref:Reverse transcriptase domain-containing protein n=1 Tax=Cryptotermes secundus TaxID=105785 RepID=A0A2J7Q2G8_9NEOP|nr:hypothetical protein B7P43_G06670 [Cryptotermes secundus]
MCQNGGVCILVKDDLSYQELDLKNLSMERVFEVCAVKIILNNRKLCILCIYRAPDGDICQFIERLDSTLSYLVSLKLEPIICGDTNINYLSENCKKVQLQALLDTYNLTQIIEFPTRISTTSVSLIDHFFIDKNAYNKFQVCSAINGLSDHDGQILILGDMLVMRQSDHVRAYRDINEENIVCFQRALQNENWIEVYNQENVNMKFNIFHNIFLSIFENSFPIVYKKKKDSNNWITKGIRISCKHKRALYILVKKSSDDSLKLYYKRYCKILVRVIREAKRLYYQKLIINSENKIQVTWKIINKESGKNQVSDKVTELQVGESRVTDPKELVRIFNKHFITVTKNLATKNADKSEAIKLLNNLKYDNLPELKLIPVTEVEIKNILKTLKSKNSTGYDGISSRILKYSINQISKPLGHILNASLERGIFPDRMKFASVRPLHKTGEKVVMANYRPISLLIIFSKIFEKAMYNRIKQHLHTNNLISSAQFGFRENRSTESAIYALTNHILETLERRCLSLGIFCDLTKAFDCVVHDILLSKLAVYGLGGKTLRWLKSYLGNRRQRVELYTNGNEKCCSGWEIVEYGVPQGSILGPLLFLLYINDLSSALNTDDRLLLYADDTSIVVSGIDIDEIQVRSNLVLNSLSRWFAVNGLSLNLKKTKVVKFDTTNRDNMSIHLKFNDEILHQETHVKFLGIEIDKTLNWKSQIESMLSRLGKACFAIRNMKLYSNIETLKMIYHAYFHSIMRYGIVFWGNSWEAKKIFLLQKRAIRIMLGMKPRESCRTVFKKLKILTLASQYILSLMILMVNNLGHYTFNHTIHGKSTRQVRNLHVPQSHLTKRQKGVYCMSVKVFNSLPDFLIELVHDKKQFIEKLKDVLLQNPSYTLEEFLLFCQDLSRGV